MKNHIDITDLENLNAKTVNVDGKRMYEFEGIDDKFPSVTTVTGLLNREHIKLWRKKVGEEKANKITAQATKRGTNFHQFLGIHMTFLYCKVGGPSFAVLVLSPSDIFFRAGTPRTKNIDK